MSRLKDLLNLSHVPRWAITPIGRPQSVAEHSFRVAAIIMELAEQMCELGLGKQDITRFTNECIRWAIVHDGPEAWTGDTPGPVKRLMKERGINLDAADYVLCPWYEEEHNRASGQYAWIEKMSKVANLIEELTWLKLYGNGVKYHYNGPDKPAEYIQEHVRKRIYRLAAEGEKDFYMTGFVAAVNRVLGEVAS